MCPIPFPPIVVADFESEKQTRMTKGIKDDPIGCLSKGLEIWEPDPSNILLHIESTGVGWVDARLSADGEMRTLGRAFYPFFLLNGHPLFGVHQHHQICVILANKNPITPSPCSYFANTPPTEPQKKLRNVYFINNPPFGLRALCCVNCA